MGWKWPLLIFLFEIMMAFLRTNVLTIILSFLGSYHIGSMMYIAWLTLNWAAFMISVVFHGPFLVNCARMIYTDSETRRRAFYESVLRLWIIYLFIDLWVVLTISPEVALYCEALSVMENFVYDRSM
jgi:hypothetical protein